MYLMHMASIRLMEMVFQREITGHLEVHKQAKATLMALCQIRVHKSIVISQMYSQISLLQI